MRFFGPGEQDVRRLRGTTGSEPERHNRPGPQCKAPVLGVSEAPGSKSKKRP